MVRNRTYPVVRYEAYITVSWICVLGAAPCVIFGFVKYHGMTAGQLTQEDLVQENSRHQFPTEMCTRKELLFWHYQK